MHNNKLYVEGNDNNLEYINADIIAEMKKQNIVLPTFSRSVQYNSYIAVQKAHKNK